MYSLILTTINHEIRAPPQSKKNFGGGGSYLVEKNIRKSVFSENLRQRKDEILGGLLFRGLRYMNQLDNIYLHIFLKFL